MRASAKPNGRSCGLGRAAGLRCPDARPRRTHPARPGRWRPCCARRRTAASPGRAARARGRRGARRSPRVKSAMARRRSPRSRQACASGVRAEARRRHVADLARPGPAPAPRRPSAAAGSPANSMARSSCTSTPSRVAGGRRGPVASASASPRSRLMRCELGQLEQRAAHQPGGRRSPRPASPGSRADGPARSAPARTTRRPRGWPSGRRPWSRPGASSAARAATARRAARGRPAARRARRDGRG